MLYYIKGKITAVLNSAVVLENNGIGYEVHVPQLSMAYIEKNKEEILIYITMMVREDDISLYGFTSRDDLEMFKKLLTVNGVGAKAALSIMSIYSTSELRKIITFEDDASLTKASGIGKKTAQRIVLELKDKMGDIGAYGESYVLEGISEERSKNDEAIEALIGLGYTKSEAYEAVAMIAKDSSSVEDLIKSALMKLSRQ